MAKSKEQEIPEGYKQTDFGIIPLDWDIKNLGELLAQPPKYGINAPAVKYSDNLPTYIRITDISEDGRFLLDNKASVNHFLAEKYYLEDGDLVFARTGASVGKTYLYNWRDGRLVFAGFLIRVKPDPKKLKPKYLSIFTKTKRYWNWVQVMSMRSGQPGINGNEYKQLPIPLPPTIEEQDEISSLLWDADALIEKTEKLLEKKKNIKQGAMQELLTCQKRLPGFSGKWKKIKLRELLDYEQPTKYIVKDAGYDDKNTIPVLTAGKTFILGYTDEERGIFSKLPVIIFDDFTTASKFVHFSFKVKSSALKILKVRNEEINLRFIFEKMQLIHFECSDHKRYWISEYRNLEIDVPEPDEQTAIANILSDMDSEIEELESQLQKYRNIKQGMMQNLLTGKIRLIKK